jgi:DNA-binding NarL/FixJ family response regulator
MSVPAIQTTETELTPELEAIARAAADLLRAQAVDRSQDRDELHARLRAAATKAIATGAELDAIAGAQRDGQARARRESGSDLLRRVERAARRRREIEHEYEDALVRATRLGLAHRDIAAAAGIAHGTVRAILARAASVADAATPANADNAASQRWSDRQ